MGTAAFIVNDDLGMIVPGATITLLGKNKRQELQAVSDANGQLTINGVDEGDYSYVAVADTHDPSNGSLTVTAGSTTQVGVLLSYDVVTLSFLVTRQLSSTSNNVTININYATALPKPALQVIPYSLDFSFSLKT